jgi:SAM-dependent methyltransferase
MRSARSRSSTSDGSGPAPRVGARPSGADGHADDGPGEPTMTAIEPKAVLGAISGGRVLDVATGAGSFVQFLLDGLRDYGEIVGIDANPERATAFTEAFGDRDDVRFVEMDAQHLAFADGSFDTVCVSNSLHHFADPTPVLAEMLRVLRPGGRVVVNEMYRDGQSETQATHVLLHHWWAAVGRQSGEIHRETYRRADIVAIVEGLGLADLRLADLADPDEDPHDPETVAELEAAIDRHVGLAKGYPELQQHGEDLRARLREVGARSATQLVAVGRR